MNTNQTAAELVAADMERQALIWAAYYGVEFVRLDSISITVDPEYAGLWMVFYDPQTETYFAAQKECGLKRKLAFMREYKSGGEESEAAARTTR